MICKRTFPDESTEERFEIVYTACNDIFVKGCATIDATFSTANSRFWSQLRYNKAN